MMPLARTLLILAAGLTVVMGFAEDPPEQPALHLDHVSIAVRDLPSAIAQFRALGFTIKPGRPHQNGIENASLKFRDGSYIEIITSHDASDRLSREYQEFLRDQEGAAYLFLRDEVAGSFTSRVLQAGGRREEADPFVFTELPAVWKTPHLQLIQYLAPAGDSAATYEHPNSARRVAAVWTFVDPRANRVAEAFGARRADLGGVAFEPRATVAAALAEDTCLVFTPRRERDPARAVALAILVEVDSLTQLTQVAGTHLLVRGAALWLPATQTHGVWLGFVERTAWAGHSMCG